MNNSQPNLVRQAEKIIEQYSKRTKAGSKKLKYFILGGLIFLTAAVTLLVLIKF